MGKKMEAHQGVHYNDLTEYETTNLKPYEAKKTCPSCDRFFIVDTLKPGRMPTYCSPSCRNKAYLKRKGVEKPHQLVIENQAQEEGLNGVKTDFEERLTKTEGKLFKKQEQGLNGVKTDFEDRMGVLEKEIRQLRLELKEAQKKNLSEWVTDAGMGIITTALGNKLHQWFTKEANRSLTRGEFRSKINELMYNHLPNPEQFINMVKRAIDEEKNPWKAREKDNPLRIKTGGFTS